MHEWLNEQLAPYYIWEFDRGVTVQCAHVHQIQATNYCTESPAARVKSIRYLGQMCVCVHECKLTGWILSAVSTVLFFNEAVCLQLSQDHQRAQEAVLHF